MFVITLQQLEMLLRPAILANFTLMALITSRVASEILFLRILGVLSVYTRRPAGGTAKTGRLVFGNNCQNERHPSRRNTDASLPGRVQNVRQRI